MSNYDAILAKYQTHGRLPEIGNKQDYQQLMLATITNGSLSDEVKKTIAERLHLLTTYSPPQDGSKGASLAAHRNCDMDLIRTLATLDNAPNALTSAVTSSMSNVTSVQTQNSLPDNTSGRSNGKGV